jgi:hypothetical protein
MPELTDLQKATLSGQVAISINTCQALRRYNSNFDMRKCLEARKIDHKGRVGRNHSRNGEYVNLAMDFLDEKYNSAMNQQIAGKQRTGKRSTKKRSTKKRNTARHTRKGR